MEETVNQLIALCHARVLRDHLAGRPVSHAAFREAVNHLVENGPFPSQVLQELEPISDNKAK